MSGGVGGWRARQAVAPPPLSRSELCPGRRAGAASQALGGCGGVGVWAANKGVPGEGWSRGPPPSAPAPGFYSPHPARDAVEYRSAQAPRLLPTLGIGCPSDTHTTEAARRGGRAAGNNSKEGDGGGRLCKM